MSTRRVTIDLRRPRLNLLFGVRPTIVINGSTQPTQWGVGTWQCDAEHDSVEVFLFVAGVAFGRASTHLGEDGATYVAPRVPLRPGRFID